MEVSICLDNVGIIAEKRSGPHLHQIQNVCQFVMRES